MDKWKDLLKIGAAVGKQFIPGAAGSVLDIVSKNILDDDDPHNEGALKALAAVNDSQTAAILALHKRLNALENK